MRRLRILKCLFGLAGLAFVCGSVLVLGINGVGLGVVGVYVLACLSLFFDRRFSGVIGILLFAGLITSFLVGIAIFCDQTDGNPDGCSKRVLAYFQSNNWIDLIYLAHLSASIALLSVSEWQKKRSYR